MYMIDTENMPGPVPFDIVRKFVMRHIKEQPRFNKLERYYRGEHNILQRKKRDDNAPNNKIVCNHAKEIADTATGYFVGNPITYSGDNAKVLHQWFDLTDIERVDLELGTDMAKFGKAYELMYMSDDNIATPRSCTVNPQNAFLVYSDSMAHKPLFGIYYYSVYDADGNHTGYRIYAYTDDRCTVYKTDTSFAAAFVEHEEENVFNGIPIIEYSNNREQQGDYEQVISLIDAYNLLASDRVNDKEQFVDAILLLINAGLGDTPAEENETKRTLRENKILSLPEQSDARYLTRTFDENGVEILKKALEQDIHKFANVPCLSDENFAGNSSGVAMEYKLLGLEMIVKIKERFFRAGAKRRIELYDAINIMKGGKPFGNVELTFTRGLPKNVNDIASVVSQLDGIVPSELLLPLLPFIKDAKGAMKLLKEEKAENTDFENARFGVPDNLTHGDGYEE